MQRSVLREVVLTHIHDLQTDDPHSTWKLAPPSMATAWMQRIGASFLPEALYISQSANRCHAGDVVCISQPPSLAKVLIHVRYGGNCLALVKFFEKCGMNTFRMSHDAGLHFVDLHCVEGALAYKQLDDERVLVAPQSFYKHTVTKGL